MATIGRLLGEGSSAQVFEDVDDPRCIIKRTVCPKSIELLRSLSALPQQGLPQVHAELAVAADGAVWFHMERLFELAPEDPVLKAAGEVLSAAYSSGSDEVQVASRFSAELSARGMDRLAGAAGFLAEFIRQKGGALDLLCSANYMKDSQGAVVFADPVAAF